MPDNEGVTLGTFSIYQSATVDDVHRLTDLLEEAGYVVIPEWGDGKLKVSKAANMTLDEVKEE